MGQAAQPDARMGKARPVSGAGRDPAKAGSAPYSTTSFDLKEIPFTSFGASAIFRMSAQTCL